MAKTKSAAQGSGALRLVILGVFLVLAFIVDRPTNLITGAVLGLFFGIMSGGAPADKPATVKPGKVRGSAWAPKTDRIDDDDDAKPSWLPTTLADSEMWPPPEDAIDHGGGLSFTYADANGEVTNRRIINWSEDGEYDHCFSGWCTDREEPRTFRIDRVQSWG